MTKPASISIVQETPKATRRASQPALTVTEQRRAARESVSSPDRIANLQAERLVFEAVAKCRPGTSRGPGSILWQERGGGGIGYGGVLQAARLYLIEHHSARAIHVEQRMPRGTERVLDRLLYNIQEAHTSIMLRDFDERQADQRHAPIDGDISAKAGSILEAAFDGMYPIMRGMKWPELDAGERNNYMRFCEMANDARKIDTDARHKERQTERLERMLREAADAADRSGQSTVDVGTFRAIIDQAFGLRSPADPAAPLPVKGGAA